MTSLCFETHSNGSCPATAVVGGHEKNGHTVYVARAEIGGELTPGKMVKEAGGAFIPWGGKENSYFTYEILNNPDEEPLEWVPGRNGEIPNGAIIGGQSRNGELQYIGRAQRDGIWVPGKLIKSHGGVLYPYGGKENGSVIYEALCIKALKVPKK